MVATAQSPPEPSRKDLRGQIGVRLPEELEIAALKAPQLENSRRFYPLTLSDITRIALAEFAQRRGIKVDEPEPTGKDDPAPARRRR